MQLSHTDLYYVGAKAHGSVNCAGNPERVSPLLNVCSIDGADVSTVGAVGEI